MLSRNVEVGQTVAAGLQAPTLFVIARDLRTMQLNASVDEADVGRVQPGQPVTFRVDAYGAESFTGRVVQVRLQPVVAQNVVSYTTVIDVPNPAQKLKPGHDRDGDHRGRPRRRRAARAGGGAPLPSDRRDAGGVQRHPRGVSASTAGADAALGRPLIGGA